MQTAPIEVLRDESKRSSRGNRIYSEERKRELVAEWRASGLTQRVFAQRAGVKYATLTSWTCRRRGLVESEAPRSPVFQEISMSAMAKATEGASLEVVLADGTVARGSDAAELAKLVRELRRR